MKTKQDFPSINERPPEGVRVDGTKIRVLIVDDSIFVAKQLGQILTYIQLLNVQVQPVLE